MPQPPLDIDTAPAAAAGRWVAHVEQLLAEHSSQIIALECVKGHVGVKTHPFQSSPLSAHARLAHAEVFAEDHLRTLFPQSGPDTEAMLLLDRASGTPTLDGRLGTALGVTDVRSIKGDGLVQTWPNVAHLLGLVCVSLNGDTPFHHALLWTFTDGGRTNGMTDIQSFRTRIERTLNSVANPDLYGHMYRLRIPHWPDRADDAMLRTWLTRTLTAVDVVAKGAFFAERALLAGAQTDRTP